MPPLRHPFPIAVLLWAWTLKPAAAAAATAPIHVPEARAASAPIVAPPMAGASSAAGPTLTALTPLAIPALSAPSLAASAPSAAAAAASPTAAAGAVLPESPIAGAALPAAFHYVVVGAGDVVKNFYSPALQDLKAKYGKAVDIKVTFIDASAFWKNNARAAEKAQKIIAELRGWGATVLDSSDEKDHAAIAALRPDAAIIAVPDFLHVDKTMEWLDRPDGPKRIYVEKPLDRDLGKAQALVNRVGYDQDRVLVLDHYAARLLPSADQLDLMSHHLGGGIESFEYYFLEDHSGSDPRHSALVNRDGAIEREQRVPALDGGMTLDGIPHLFPLLSYFADLERIHITGVRAAQYTGVDGDPEKRAEIKGETFSEIRFNFFRKPMLAAAAAAVAEGVIKGVAYVGKGVRGVQALGPEYEGNVKLLRIKGLNGRSIDFDLRSASPDDRHAKAYLRGADGRLVSSFPLYAKPYRVLFERMLWGVADGLRIEQAERILEAIVRIINPIRAQNPLPTYRGGVKNVRPSDWLEEIAAPYLFNHEPPAGPDRR